MTHDYYIGLMSGTSIDSIDAALVDFADGSPRLVATHSHAFPDSLRQEIIELCQPGENGVNRLGSADVEIGKLFADACNALLKVSKLNAEEIHAIGSHGQTVRHHPALSPAFTIQIGDPNTIAALTGITTVADFRRKDIAHGGQGAPFAPAFHQVIRRSKKTHVMLNIGGIANVTYLPSNPAEKITGFDTGPGNTLLDLWCKKHCQKNFDRDGQWAANGKVNHALLQLLLQDCYFQKIGPKSTGREYFNLFWLERSLKRLEQNIEPPDVQTTLTELTAQTIADAIKQIAPDDADVLVCGGGAHNKFLMQRLSEKLAPRTVQSSAKFELNPDWIEAMAFAWFAKQTMEKKKVDLTQITGARKPAILGGIYYP